MTKHMFSTKAHETPVDIGVARKDRKQLARELSTALADTYLLYGDTQSVHWNAAGPLFQGGGRQGSFLLVDPVQHFPPLPVLRLHRSGERYGAVFQRDDLRFDHRFQRGSPRRF